MYVYYYNIKALSYENSTETPPFLKYVIISLFTVPVRLIIA